MHDDGTTEPAVECLGLYECTQFKEIAAHACRSPAHPFSPSSPCFQRFVLVFSLRCGSADMSAVSKEKQRSRSGAQLSSLDRGGGG
jgi:hypothetical protein